MAKPLFELREDNLEKCWFQQENLMHDAARELADARLDYEEAKAALAVVEADKAHDMRKNPQKYGMDKSTEAGIERHLPSLNKYKKAVAAINECRHAMELAKAQVEILNNRKAALEGLVKLFGMGYFAKPTDEVSRPKALPKKKKRKRK